MLPTEKKKRIIAFFAGVFVLYSGMLVFFILFTPGLDLVEEKVGESIDIFVSNSSIHTIKEVRIETQEGRVLLSIPELKPGEKAAIPLQGLTDLVVLNAKAPFHASVSRSISLKGAKGLKLSYETSFQTIAFTGIKFSVFLNICNSGSINIEELVVEEQHKADFFSESRQSKKTALKIGECKKLEFQLSPTKVGETEIYFNIDTLGVSEKFSRKIEIREG